MNYLQKIGLFLFSSILIIGCTDKIKVEQENFTIEFGSECGWCGGQEFINVTRSKVEYKRNIPCGENRGTIDKSRDLSSEEWKEITSSFDYSLFKTLDYTNCNVCVDGCDEIIRITDEDFTHELRYSFSDEVKGMKNLRGVLSEIMNEMRAFN